MTTTTERADDVLKGIVIPPRPSVLVEIGRELQLESPNLKTVAALIARDVGLSSGVLQTVNSAFFGLPRKIASIPQAVQMIGARNVANIVNGVTLRAAIGTDAMSLERFWDSAEKVACIAAYVARLLPRTSPDEGYTLGLFRDCGIPLMMRRFPDYKATLRDAGGDDMKLIRLEDERHGTNHATVGFIVGRMWELPETLCQAILHHHDAAVFDRGTAAQAGMPVTLLALNAFAERLHDETLRMRVSDHWARIGTAVLDELGFTNAEQRDIEEEISAMWA